MVCLFASMVHRILRATSNVLLPENTWRITEEMEPATRSERTTYGLGNGGWGVAQVLDKVGNPLIIAADYQFRRLALSVSF